MEKEIDISSPSSEKDQSEVHFSKGSFNEKDVGDEASTVYVTLEETKYSDEEITAFMEVLGYAGEDLSIVPDDVSYILSKVPLLTYEESIEVLKTAIEEHEGDENIPIVEYDTWIRLVEENDNSNVKDERDIFLAKACAATVKYHSPYAEVRAVVSPVDDPTIPIETFRAYFLALVFSIVGCGFNQFFTNRVVAISVNTSVAQIFLAAVGPRWAKFVPCWGFTWKGKKYGINIPSPWTRKEQMFATLLFGICTSSFYTNYNILTQKMYYDQHGGFGYQLLLSLSIQYIGFGFAGILRRFVVYPARSIWPTSMPTLALNNALLEEKSEVEEGHMSRFKVFMIFFCGIFIWDWVPQFLMDAMSTFNWMTWIAPNNINLANITGGIYGIGFNPITSFDWNVISQNSPLVVPFFSQLQQYLGSVFCALVVIAVYYTNYYDTQYLPMFSNVLYTNKATAFQVTEILTPDNKLDWDKYQKYSPPYFTAGYLVSYGAFIAFYPLLIGYSLLIYHKMFFMAFKTWFSAIWSFRKPRKWVAFFTEKDRGLENHHDAHSIMMRAYPEVPDWWYLAILIIFLVIGIITVEVFHTNTPVWALFMSLGFNFVFLIPLTILQATAGFSVGLNLLIEMIMGYALPGNPMALMIIKAFGYNIDGQADNYVSNLKLAHYTKINPVSLFKGQLSMVMVQVFVCLGVLNWQIYNVKDFCQPDQHAKFECPGARTYYNSSVMWGVIGPKRIFQGVYPIFKWCWLIGACLGLFFGAWQKWGRYYPRTFSPPLFVGGMLNVGPPYGLMYYTPGMIVSYFSQYWLKRHHLKMWERYNYVVSGALAAGIVFGGIIIFFAVQYKQVNLAWWGNDVVYAGADAVGYPLKNISTVSKGYFGKLPPGHYP